MPKNDWSEYKKLVLFEIQENGKRFENISEMISALKEDVSGLKGKAAVAGGVAGLIGTAIISLIVNIWK